ncbi:MAG TPA: S1/P1 nuclease [Chthoniobacter sp.]|jgi:hypothetical protein
MRFPVLFLGALLILAVNAYPWGGEGHRAIAWAVRTQLSPEARAKIEKILGNDDLAAEAGWLDDVRIARRRHSGPLKDDPEAQEFNNRFSKNDVWHYIDLPVGSATYAESSPLASKDDIVHAIDHAIDVLEGRASDLTERQALRVLIHLVGDAHQPLHAAAGYYDLSDSAHPKLVSDPAIAATKPHDRGGNQLFYDGALQLHALWDDVMVMDLIRATPHQSLASQLRAEADNQNWMTPGDYHHWAEKWIEDSAAQAVEVYRGIVFGAATIGPKDTIERIEITLPEGYVEKQLPRAKTQLAKAAAHLAQLLNSIRFQ